MKASPHERENAAPGDATCIGCGYRLAHLPGQTCPECGCCYDPGDPGTFRSASSPAGWRRWAKPPGMAECLVFMGVSGLGIVGASGPARWQAAGVFLLGVIGVPIWLGLAVVYLLRVTACSKDRDRALHDRVAPRHHWRWIVVPACILLVCSTFLHPWPLMIRFRLSQRAFEAALEDHQSGRLVADRWIGLYHVGEVEDLTFVNHRPISIVFITGDSIADPVGFVYDPVPNHPAGVLTMEVAPSWYTHEY